MSRRGLVIVLALLAAVTAIIWQVHLAAQIAVVVEADRVRFGPTEWVPRCLGAPDCVEVGAGEIRTLPVAFVTAMVLPGGWATLPCGQTYTLLDRPLDTTTDPFQWGHGIVVFGHIAAACPTKTAVVELVDDPQAGATTLTLASAPSGWQVGDELLLPNTTQARATFQAPRLATESSVFIAGLSGTTVTLSKPLDFAHPSVRDPAGGLVLRPRVANLSRDTIIRSEGQTTPGHFVKIGAGASWDVEGIRFEGVGRTRNAVRDNTSADLSHIGTNQIGKYADHDHQTGTSAATRITRNNVYLAGVGDAWAKAVHATHDTVIEDNLAIGFGSGFVTEDGSETGNAFRRNIAALGYGNGANAKANVQNGCPGCEGSGFWFKGLENIIEDNEAWNNTVGINLFSQLVAPADDDRVPISMTGNVALGNEQTGFEYWGVEPFDHIDALAAQNGMRQVWGAQLGGNHVYLVNPRLIDSAGRSDCIEASAAYTFGTSVIGGELRGCREGIGDGMSHDHLVLRDVLMQNETNLRFTSLNKPQRATIGVTFRQFGTKPKQYIVYGPDASVWSPGQPVDKFAYLDWQTHRGARHEIINWQGTGQDYVLLHPQQRRDLPIYSTADAGSLTNRFFLPEAGLTVGQAWDKYGMAPGGDVWATGQAFPLDGLIYGVARPTLARPLGQPRAVLTLPNAMAPAVVATIGGQPGIELLFMRTGLTGGPVQFTLDGGPVQTASQVSAGDLMRFVSRATSDGAHTVVAWREQAPSQAMTFVYVVGTGVPPPPPPPPPPNPCLTPVVPVVGNVLVDGVLTPWTGTITVLNGDGCPVTITR